MVCEYGFTIGRDVTGTKTSSGTRQVFTDSIGSGGGLNAFGVVVRFQSTDFQTTKATSASTTSAVSLTSALV